MAKATIEGLGPNQCLARDMTFGQFARVLKTDDLIMRVGLGYVYLDGQASFSPDHFHAVMVEILPKGTIIKIEVWDA
jgi:hypothetical protein